MKIRNILGSLPMLAMAFLIGGTAAVKPVDAASHGNKSSNKASGAKSSVRADVDDTLPWKKKAKKQRKKINTNKPINAKKKPGKDDGIR